MRELVIAVPDEIETRPLANVLLQFLPAGSQVYGIADEPGPSIKLAQGWLEHFIDVMRRLEVQAKPCRIRRDRYCITHGWHDCSYAALRLLVRDMAAAAP